MNGRAASSATVNWVQRSCAISAAERHPSSASRYPRVVGYLVMNGTTRMCHRRSPLSLGSARGRPHPGPRLGVPVAATRPPWSARPEEGQDREHAPMVAFGRLQVELRQDAADVLLDRALGDDEPGCDADV